MKTHPAKSINPRRAYGHGSLAFDCRSDVFSKKITLPLVGKKVPILLLESVSQATLLAFT